jgi:uncharacterized membrane protein YphA (DoxX/SURF4 family)
MSDGMAEPHPRLARLDLPGWKTALNWASAILLAVLFLSSGIWKVTDVPGWAVRLTQAKIPEWLSIPGTIVIGVSETVAGVFLLTPRLRRWGGMLAGALLIVFLFYFAVFYNDLRGQDCSCFPWLKRVVGPGFFIGDGVMLAMAMLAGIWARRPEGLRPAVLIVSAVTVFAVVSYGVEAVRHSGARAPATVTVDGQPYDISRGKVALFFFNPACTHCMDVAKSMTKLAWDDARVVAVPVEMPQFGPGFLADSGLKAALTSDFNQLKDPLGYRAYPYLVAVVDGRVKASLNTLGGAEPTATLKALGFAH